MIDDERQFTALSERQCRDLLETHTVGRIAWQAADGPQILPISYIWRANAAIFRTSPDGMLSELIHSTDVAFQVDELDEEFRSGWSVLVQGTAEMVAEPAELVDLWAADGLVPWAPGIRNVFIRVEPRRITGRLLRSRIHGAEPTDLWSRD